MNELQVMNINGVECYEKDGTAYLKLEAVARGLGFTQEKNGVGKTAGCRMLGVPEKLDVDRLRKTRYPMREEGQT